MGEAEKKLSLELRGRGEVYLIQNKICYAPPQYVWNTGLCGGRGSEKCRDIRNADED